MTGHQPGDPQSAQRPPASWLVVKHGVVGLEGAPPPGETIHIALHAAVLTAHAEPGAELLDWFAAHRHQPLTWEHADTSTLVRLLRNHEPSGWQLLETTGVLDRALPEIAAAVRRRRDATDSPETLSVLRFRVAERLDDLAIETGHPSDDLVLAGLVADVCSDAPAPQSCWTTLLDRLLADDGARRISAIVSDARLLRASADDPRGFEEREILQLATHLGSTSHTRDAYQLALALGALTTGNRGTLDERRGLIDEVFGDPELSDGDATGLAAARRLSAQRIATDDAVIERLRFAPISYVLSHTSQELADQARLIDPLPPPGRVRVAVKPAAEPKRWVVAVACGDASALLAHLAGVLARRGLDIVDATIGTWPDGAVLDSFVVVSTDAPQANELVDDFEGTLRQELHAPIGTALTAEFNNEVLPWHTVCDVTGPDQPGALLAISAAFARAEIVVYSASVATTDQSIQDRFTISDRLGRKLDESSIERVRRGLGGTGGDTSGRGSSDVVGRS